MTAPMWAAAITAAYLALSVPLAVGVGTWLRGGR